MSTDSTPNDTPKLSAKEITDRLAAPFGPNEVKCKPGKISGNRAMVIFYVDARLVEERLDAVVGVTGWQDDFKIVQDGSVVCKLSVRIGDEWVTKVDVGGQSKQEEAGNRLKSAFSDALKRVAVKFGIGRHLYRIPNTWVDYDPQKKQFVNPPSLPSPRPTAVAKSQPKPVAPAPANGAKPQQQPAEKALPRDGVELVERLEKFEAAMVKAGECKPLELMAHVQVEGVKNGWPNTLRAYTEMAIAWAVECVKAFAAARKAERTEAAGTLPREKRDAVVAEFGERINAATDKKVPGAECETLAEVEAAVMAAGAEIGRDARDDLVRTLREKAAAKPKRAKAG